MANNNTVNHTALKLLITGGTFGGVWASLGHGGLGGVVAAGVAYVVLEHSDGIINKVAGKFSPQRQVEAEVTAEELAEYRRIHGMPDQQQPGAGTTMRERQDGGADDELDLQSPRKAGPFLFSSILEHFTPTLDKIYLVTLPNGTHIFCNYKELCHVALAGTTDAGKSNIMRMLVTQLCYVGAKVLILNPHWTGYVLDKQEDWTPIIPYLFDDPMETRKYEKIDYYLNYLANTTIPHRLELFAYSKPTGKPIFVVIDELPAIVKRLKQVSGYLDTILKEGRKVGVYLISAAQDFLVDTIGGTDAVRDCYRTAYSVGGDNTTTNKLLGKTKADRPLGKGVVLLRNASSDLCKEAVVALVPYVDNKSLYRLLGPSTYEPSVDVDAEELEDFELEEARAQTEGDIQRDLGTGKVTVTPNVPEIIEKGIVLGKDSSTGHDVTLTREEFHIAVNMRKSGMSTGHRDLMPVFNLSEHHARVLNKLVREKLGLDTKSERDRKGEREGE